MYVCICFDVSVSDSLTSDAMGFCTCELFKIGDNEMLSKPSQNKSSVEIYTLHNREKVATLTPSSGEKSCGMCMAIRVVSSACGVKIFTGYEDGSIVLWDTSKWKELSTLKCHSESVMAMDYNSEINKGFSATALDTIVQWDLKDGNELELSGERKITNPGVGCLHIRKDGKLFVTGGWDSQARLFGCKKMKPLAVLSYHSGSVQCAHFLEDNTLILGSKDGCISFWSLYK